jgi:hypothetical protein
LHYFLAILSYLYFPRLVYARIGYRLQNLFLDESFTLEQP